MGGGDGAAGGAAGWRGGCGPLGAVACEAAVRAAAVAVLIPSLKDWPSQLSVEPALALRA